MSFIGLCVIGLITGSVARLVLPSKHPVGSIVTILLGIVGSLMGGYMGRFVGFYKPDEELGLAMSVLGAVAFPIIFRWLRPSSA